MSRIYASGFTRIPVFRYSDGLGDLAHTRRQSRERWASIRSSVIGAAASLKAEEAMAAATPATDDDDVSPRIMRRVSFQSEGEGMSPEAKAAAAAWGGTAAVGAPAASPAGASPDERVSNGSMSNGSNPSLGGCAAEALGQVMPILMRLQMTARMAS